MTHIIHWASDQTFFFNTLNQEHISDQQSHLCILYDYDYDCVS